MLLDNGLPKIDNILDMLRFRLFFDQFFGVAKAELSQESKKIVVPVIKENSSGSFDSIVSTIKDITCITPLQFVYCEMCNSNPRFFI